MNFETKILNFEEDKKGTRLGYCDVKITYSEKKWEIFRQVAVFSQEDKIGISFPKTKRDENWVPLYERNPKLNMEIIASLVRDLKKLFKSNHVFL